MAWMVWDYPEMTAAQELEYFGCDEDETPREPWEEDDNAEEEADD